MTGEHGTGSYATHMDLLQKLYWKARNSSPSQQYPKEGLMRGNVDACYMFTEYSLQVHTMICLHTNAEQ